MATCENRNEQLLILVENGIRDKDIQKAIDLCNLMVYYNDKINNR
jgi:hypothetical protein